MMSEKKGVIYTCITGAYDELRDHAYVSSDWDYVCFTDNLSVKNDQNSSWEVRPLFFKEMDDVRNQRWHKMHPHILFPDYEQSIWIDSNLNILSSSLFDDVDKAIDESQLISIAPHPERDCVYDELVACIKFGKDNVDLMKKQVDLIRKNGFPKNQGMFETNIMYRKHQSATIIKLMNDWWWWVKNYSRRDQLSITYVIWKNKLRVIPLTDISYRRGNRVSFIYGKNHITKEELISQREKLQKVIEKKNHEINVLNNVVKNKASEIKIMKSSKFWKIRDRYIKMRGLSFVYFRDLFNKAFFVLRRDGISVFVRYVYKYLIHGRKYFKSKIAPSVQNYYLWIEKNEKFDSREIYKKIIDFDYKPKISIITPVYNVDVIWLDKCIQSVLDQFYENWELCIHDDASTKKETIKCLKRWEKKDSRIKISYGKKNQHISGASNEALKLATGEFIALLDNDDELSKDALYENVKLLNQNTKADFIYSDEDKIEEDGTRLDAYFKPDWSLAMFLSMNYSCHLSVYRKKIIDEIGGFRKGYEGSQDYDLALRFIEKVDEKNIFHIPRILYHWRKIAGSTAQRTDSKNYAYVAAKKALSDYMKRNNIRGQIEDGIFLGSYRVKRELYDRPLVSVIIPTKDKITYLKPCVLSVLNKTDYSNLEIIILDTGSVEDETKEFYKEMESENKIRVINYPKSEFNFAEANTWAVQHANGEYVLFLNNDTKVLNDDWLSNMMEYAQINKVGIVGAKLLFPDNTIQHMGIVVGLRNGASHAGVLFPEWQLMSFPFLHAKDVVRNVSAVTGACLLIRKSIFNEVGGFDKIFKIAFNDTDLCLKVRDRGYEVIYTPYAKLTHYESITFGRPYEDPTRSTDLFEMEQDIFNKKWKYDGFEDPFYNKNLTLKDESLKLRV